MGAESEELDDAVCCSNKASQSYNSEDNALSGIPDRYAVTDCGMPVTGRWYKPCYREDFENRFKYTDELTKMGAKHQSGSAIQLVLSRC